MISKLSAKYHIADTKDGKVHRIRESPSNPRKSIFNFNLVQRALVLEDCAPALGWGEGGLLVGKRVQEVWEKKRKKGKIIIIINKKLTGRVGVNSRLGLGSLAIVYTRPFNWLFRINEWRCQPSSRHLCFTGRRGSLPVKSQVVLLQTAHSWANAGVVLGARMHRISHASGAGELSKQLNFRRYVLCCFPTNRNSHARIVPISPDVIT